MIFGFSQILLIKEILQGKKTGNISFKGDFWDSQKLLIKEILEGKERGVMGHGLWVMGQVIHSLLISICPLIHTPSPYRKKKHTHTHTFLILHPKTNPRIISYSYKICSHLVTKIFFYYRSYSKIKSSPAYACLRARVYTSLGHFAWIFGEVYRVGNGEYWVRVCVKLRNGGADGGREWWWSVAIYIVVCCVQWRVRVRVRVRVI